MVVSLQSKQSIFLHKTGDASPTLILDHQCYLWAFHGHRTQYISFNRLSSGKIEWQMHILAERKVGYQQNHYAEDSSLIL
jgi:hypothetical protein